MTYKISTNLNIKDAPRAACVQYFTHLEDLIAEIKESLTKCPDMKLTIEVEKE